MKKFSELNNNDKTVEASTNKQDFIQNLVEESLTVVDGEIIGKDVLVQTLNRIITLNDSKTRIQVLESVKVSAYRGGFDFNKISEAIELEKQKLNAPIEVEETVEETIETEGDMFFAQPNDTIVSVRESVETEETTEEETTEEVIEEGKKDDCKKCDDDDKEDDDGEPEIEEDDKDDEDDDTVKESIESEETTEEVIEEANEEDIAIKEVEFLVSDYEQEKSDLTSLYENILNEDHLNTKKDKIKYILDNCGLEEEEKEKKEAELKELDDKKLDAAYKKCEIDCEKK